MHAICFCSHRAQKENWAVFLNAHSNMFPERWKVTDLHLAGGAENVNSEMSFILWQLVAVL